MYNTEIRVASTAAPSYNTVTNVGGFGWTGADQGHYNQLIQYVEECRQIGVVVSDQATLIASVVAEADNIRGAIEYVKNQSAEVSQQAEQVRTNLAKVESMVASVESSVGSMTRTYEDFVTKYLDFLTKYEEIMNKFP